MNESLRIIPYYSHPHVHVVIRDNTFYDETTGTPEDIQMPYSTLVFTGADQGIDNVLVKLDSINVKKAIFGNGNFQKYGQSSLQADLLFNGSTSVWFCRVLPDDATYANVIILAHYRKGNVLDDLEQETGLKRMEIKFSVAYADKNVLTEGAREDEDIIAAGLSMSNTTPDAQTGYMTLPVTFIRSIGRGKYGNNYSILLNRDVEAEKEYEMKMYKWSLVLNSSVSRIINVFSGSLYQTTRGNISTLISDVLDQYSTGSCPVRIYSYEDTWDALYDFYMEIVKENSMYLASIDASEDQLKDLAKVQGLKKENFDPLFGLVLNTKSNESIPYYRNYTVKTTGAYVAPDLTVATNSALPLNVTDWNTAAVGNSVVVTSDEVNGGLRWRYKVSSVDAETGNIIYDEGEEAHLDDDQYDGTPINRGVGNVFTCGHDGIFQEISSNGVTRAPSAAEMKLLLSREYVKLLRGEKDRNILSPYRINLDFIFDANYNMTQDVDMMIDDSIQALYSNSTVLTDEDYKVLSVLASSDDPLDLSDINVKAAMYDLNEFRCRNGMTINPEMGAGCLLHLDTNLVGLKSTSASTELQDTFEMFSDITGRQTAIDIGSYEIFDPYTGRRIRVTTMYNLAEHLVPHLLDQGLAKPYTYDYATMTALQRSDALTGANMMIRGSFLPDIDIIDWDVKEYMYTNRFNYWISGFEGREVKRACQNTRQLQASMLLEENNVRVLNTLKKNLEEDCQHYLYEWNEPEARESYTEIEMTKFEPWIGDLVQDLDIYFDADAWEQERMIMHCYANVAFRDIIKRIIIEININRANYGSGSAAEDEEGGEDE